MINERKILIIDICQVNSSSISEAVDNPDLELDSTGDLAWVAQDEIYYYGGSSAESCSLVDSEQSCEMTASVLGKVWISFYWKLDAEEEPESVSLSFHINGELAATKNVSQDWHRQIFKLETNSNYSCTWIFQNEDLNTGTGNSRAWVDKIEILPIESLSEAVDLESSYDFETWGNAEWYSQYNISYCNGSSAQSGKIGHSEYTSMSTMTYVECVSFWWNLESEGGGYDYLTFYIDGVLDQERYGFVYWENVQQNFHLGLHNFTWSYRKNTLDRYYNGQSSGWVDKISFQCEDTTYLSDAMDAPELVFRTGGNAKWKVTEDTSAVGKSSLVSGPITHDELTWIETKVKGPTMILFWMRVSSEDKDPLTFYINGVVESTISYFHDWEEYVIMLDEESNTLRWEYSRNFGRGWGDNCGWIDGFVLNYTEPTPSKTSTSDTKVILVIILPSVGVLMCCILTIYLNKKKKHDLELEGDEINLFDLTNNANPESLNETDKGKKKDGGSKKHLKLSSSSTNEESTYTESEPEKNNDSDLGLEEKIIIQNNQNSNIDPNDDLQQENQNENHKNTNTQNDNVNIDAENNDLYIKYDYQPNNSKN
ncbi:hypothetical protein M0812_08897 [Anaeramoeba flamelloides]|uniref:Uncharacterized protein n=1 Tax=Anaeramoeba flamelloides TaxID=1746091 RepID=A0AAV7ZYS2_9EUKA|nr:hypothetical protein M0812_08897 [Anaeramoeba flamelloides]